MHKKYHHYQIISKKYKNFKLKYNYYDLKERNDIYRQVLRRDLPRALLKKRPGVSMEHVILHQDNAPAHTAETTRTEIGLLGCQLLDHPPYSPDLAPMDFRIFPVVKSALKGQRFDSFQELSNAIHRVVYDLESEWFRDMFDQWIERHNKCISVQGDYIEK